MKSAWAFYINILAQRRQGVTWVHCIVFAWLMLSLVSLKPSSGRRLGLRLKSDVYSGLLHVGPKSVMLQNIIWTKNISLIQYQLLLFQNCIFIQPQTSKNDNCVSFESLLGGNLLKNVVNERIFCPQTKSWFCENRKWFLSLQSSQKCKDLLISKFGAAMSWKFWTFFELASY